MLKQLPLEITELQSFIEQYEIQQSCAVTEKPDKTYDNIALLDSWINLIPQMPYQNFVNCYGIIRIVNNYYIVTDLIEDNVNVGTDNSDYDRLVDESIEAMKNRTAKENVKDLT